MNRTAMSLVGAAVIAGALLFFFGGGGPTVSAEQARALVKEGALLLDVRTPAEFASGHVEGAVNIPVQELEAKLPPEKDRTVVVYCHSGRRSAAAKELLLAAGFVKVFDLGAMSNWK